MTNGNRIRINYLEGSYAHHYTINADTDRANLYNESKFRQRRIRKGSK